MLIVMVMYFSLKSKDTEFIAYLTCDSPNKDELLDVKKVDIDKELKTCSCKVNSPVKNSLLRYIKC